MRLPFTLSLYIGRHFIISCLIVLLLFSCLIITIDSFELLRKAYGKNVPFGIILEMAILKFPHWLQKLIPFIMLLASMMTFTKLTRTSELVVTRASGISAWQFLLPPIFIALIIGIFFGTVANPLSSAMVTRFELLESRYFGKNSQMLSISSSGLWLKQITPDKKNKTILHALHLKAKNTVLEDVTFFEFSGDNTFLRRIDAKQAMLKPGKWELSSVRITDKDNHVQELPTDTIATTIIPEQIGDSFASPESISFWELPAFINTLKNAGFSALNHRYYFHSLLATPFLLCAMVLISSAFSLSPTRQGKSGILIVSGIGIGFVIYFFTNLISALGLSGSIPIVLAAWAPVIISVFFGLILLLHLEDG